VEIYSAAGDDRIDFSGVKLPVHVHAGDGDDAIIPGEGKDILDGQAGNDTVIGQQQPDETDDKHSHASSITDDLDTDISIENVIA
jgi:Ca2+-binding RTX toxin-like protein